MKSKKGFTLVELVVVVGIMGILFTLTLSIASGYRKQIRNREFVDNMDLVSGAVETLLQQHIDLSEYKDEGFIDEVNRYMIKSNQLEFRSVSDDIEYGELTDGYGYTYFGDIDQVITVQINRTENNVLVTGYASEVSFKDNKPKYIRKLSRPESIDITN